MANIETNGICYSKCEIAYSVIATGHGLDCQGFGVQAPVGAKFFSYPRLLYRFRGQPRFLFSRHRGIFLWAGSEADHLLSTSTDVKNT
jgi:hypothetical protein